MDASQYAKLFREQPSEAVAAIEALRGLIVLRPWENAVPGRHVRKCVLFDCPVFEVHFSLVNNWYWTDYTQFGGPVDSEEGYYSPELAMAAADAALDELPNVVLVKGM